MIELSDTGALVMANTGLTLPRRLALDLGKSPGALGKAAPRLTSKNSAPGLRSVMSKATDRP